MTRQVSYVLISVHPRVESVSQLVSRVSCFILIIPNIVFSAFNVPSLSCVSD